MLLDLFYLFAVLIAGYAVPKVSQQRAERLNQLTQLIIFSVLFCMGWNLTALEDIKSEVLHIVYITAVFFGLQLVANLVALLQLDRWLKLSLPPTKQRSRQGASALLQSLPIVAMIVLGAGVGHVFPQVSVVLITSFTHLLLAVLLFFVGMQLKYMDMTLKQILFNRAGVLIASVVTLSSWVAGLVASLWLNMSTWKALALASGFGWYSLSGILIGQSFGPADGSASFMIELSREMAAFLLIPWLINRFPCTAIGYAATTAIDFTLPLIQKSGGAHAVPIAMVSGFLLSLIMPSCLFVFVWLAH